MLSTILMTMQVYFNPVESFNDSFTAKSLFLHVATPWLHQEYTPCTMEGGDTYLVHLLSFHITQVHVSSRHKGCVWHPDPGVPV